MSYRQSLEAAGARVLAFEYFGDWQGSWIALADYNGEQIWIQGSFGSCTHCDAFEAEFGLTDIDEQSEDYNLRLADFGRSYLESPIQFDNLLRRYLADSEWDFEAQDIVFWIRETAQTYGVAA